VTEKKKAGSSLFSDSDGDDDDLFAYKKPTNNKKMAYGSKQKAVTDLFGSDDIFSKAPQKVSYGGGYGGGYGQKSYNKASAIVSTSKPDDSNAVIKELKERVELDFLPTNSKRFHPSELVELELDVKNVPTLIVKVFEINTINYYRDKLSDVPININLDGLVPHEEKLYNYTEPPIRRIRRKFGFPSLNNKRGVFVIDFIGNGKTSRALIYKGQLNYLQKLTVAGHAIVVFDQDLTPLKRPSIILDRRVYKADSDGEIIVPYSNNGQSVSHTIILIDNDTGKLGDDNNGNEAVFASLASGFVYQPEQYSFKATFHLLHESFVSGRDYEVVIRPALRCNGVSAPLSLLREASLTISYVDHKGITTNREVKNLQLKDDLDYVARFPTPDRVAKVQFSLVAKVALVSKSSSSPSEQQQEEDQQPKVDNQHYQSLSDTSGWYEFNGIECETRFADCFLRGDRNSGYSILALGRTGERLKRLPIELSLSHDLFLSPFTFSLQTNDQGVLQLGALPSDITKVRATMQLEQTPCQRQWILEESERSSSKRLLLESYRIPVGETLQLNALNPKKEQQIVKLFEISPHNSSVVRDWTKEAVVHSPDGLLTISGLDVGSYVLVSVRIISIHFILPLVFTF